MEIQAEVSKVGFNLPVLLDRSQQLSRMIGFVKTSEVAIIDTSTWSVVYLGAIDDSLNTDIDKTSASTNYLEDNLENYLGSKKIKYEKTQTFGCSLFYDESSVTYTKDISKIFALKCLSCHASGGVFPDLSSYEKVKAWSTMSAELIRTNKMPPVSLDVESKLVSYDKALLYILTPEQQRSIFKWIDQGLPKGKGSAFKFVPENKIYPKPQHVFSSGPIEVPVKGPVPLSYRQIGGPTEKDIWIDKIRFHTESSHFHHVHLMVVPNSLKYFEKNNSLSKMHYLSKKKNDSIIHWRPKSYIRQKQNWVTFPKDTALLIPKGSYLILESHLRTSGVASTTELQVMLHEIRPQKSTKQVFVGFISKKAQGPNEIPFLPIGATNVTIEDDRAIDKNISIVRVTFHMHLRGSSIKMNVIDPNNVEKTIASIPNFSDLKINSFDLTRPYEIQKGSRIRLVGVYDNSKFNNSNPDPNKNVRIGPSFETDEMLNAVYHYYVK